MAKPLISTKRLLIDKTNRRIVIFVAIASFITVFSLVASRALLSQRGYQARVTAKKEKAVKQLKDNVDAVSTLKTSYTTFVGSSENVLGGNPSGQGDKDGDNAKIILDALPSKYDFPALAASLEKVLTSSTQSLKIIGISGTDQEVAESSNTSSSAPVPVPMPFQVSVGGNYAAMQILITTLEKSIRPIQIQRLSFTGSDDKLVLSITAQSFYQPAKTLSITKEDVQ